jgi:molecular chaperone DnaK
VLSGLQAASAGRGAGPATGAPAGAAEGSADGGGGDDDVIDAQFDRA